ncbi:hypothetical protein KGQ20_29280 [Catenulispora sp. NF23]|uniref:Uncharacterized protein n=1 Tax=Catenulispora pinistramenti TaxID=2705254 RepID=A0ABS5KQ59_9ACTN|nr:hypothetical protein [Catenulispora pinistramenti]MBS2536863.1 hypothetical protein [Catenulispora pinistramenti]MBS2548188.1 hypothetical protein [Catenulispora pinistramenti]
METATAHWCPPIERPAEPVGERVAHLLAEAKQLVDQEYGSAAGMLPRAASYLIDTAASAAALLPDARNSELHDMHGLARSAVVVASMAVRDAHNRARTTATEAEPVGGGGGPR